MDTVQSGGAAAGLDELDGFAGSDVEARPVDDGAVAVLANQGCRWRASNFRAACRNHAPLGSRNARLAHGRSYGSANECASNGYRKLRLPRVPAQYTIGCLQFHRASPFTRAPDSTCDPGLCES